MKNSRTLALALALGPVFSCGIREEPIEVAPPIAHPAVAPGDTDLEQREGPEVVPSAVHPDLDLGDASLAWSEPVEVENLKLWPILETNAKDPAARPAYLTLDEALGTGVATVVETGSVQALELVNESDRPILLLSGEVLQGGRQDRIIAHDTEIPPGERMPLASFCVEHGRWSANDGDANGGKVFCSAGLIAANSVRSAAQVAGSQSQVWSNVACANDANDVTSTTGAYLATGADPKLQERVKQHAAQLIEWLEQHPDAIGFVAAVDPGKESEEVAAELFGDAHLFRAYREKLVRSYCLDALTRSNARRNGLPVPMNALSPDEFATSDWSAVDLNGSGGGLSNVNLPILTTESRELPVPRVGERVEASTPELEHLHRTVYLPGTSPDVSAGTPVTDEGSAPQRR